MTGGAGFSMDSNNRSKDNHKLGKIRGNATYSAGKNDPNYRSQADSEALNEAIAHRFKRKKELQRIYLDIAPRDSISRSGLFIFMTIRNCTSKGQKATYYVVNTSNAGTSIIRHAFLDLAGVPRLGGSSRQISKESEVTGIIADNPIYFSPNRSI
jgi:hypothetical protein